MALKEIETISEIFCISLKGEVKEMLLHISPETGKEIRITCTDIGTMQIKETIFSKDINTIPDDAASINGYFFEVGSSIIKVRKHHTYASSYHLKSIDKKTPFYTGEKLIPEFIGKCLTIITSFIYNPKQIKIYLKANKISNLNIKARGLSIDTIQLFKKFEVKEGGDDYLFICPYQSKNIVIHCKPL